MPAKPKPQKKEKTVLDRIEAFRMCKTHGCPKWQCVKQHRKAQCAIRKPILSKTPIQNTYPPEKRSERRVFSKTERTHLEKQLDIVCSEFVRIRDGRCVTCGSSRNLECSHFIGRAKSLYLRWDVEYNLSAQCQTCNRAHNDPDEVDYERYLVKKHGAGIVQSLKKHSGKTFKWTVPELREMLEERKRQLDELRRDSSYSRE
jgi:hypothetical protein